MAPPDRSPDPYHSAATGVDSEFGHVGEIAAWVEWLLHPEEHHYDRMIILGDGTKVESRGNLPIKDNSIDPNGPLVPDPVKPTEYYPFESVIEGCYIEQFFDPALALSGQHLDGEYCDLSKVFKGLCDTSWKNDDWIGKLSGQFEDLRQVWEGSAGLRAGEFLGAIDDFMKDFNRIAVELAAVLLEYGGVIDAARKSLNNAMGKLVDAFHRKFYANENPLEKVLIKALVAISGAALTYVSGGTAAAAWAAGMTAVIDKTLDSGGPEIGGTTWRKLVDDYFVAQAEILRLVRAEIDRLNDDLTRLAGRLVDMPKLPG